MGTDLFLSCARFHIYSYGSLAGSESVGVFDVNLYREAALAYKAVSQSSLNTLSVLYMIPILQK